MNSNQKKGPSNRKQRGISYVSSAVGGSVSRVSSGDYRYLTSTTKSITRGGGGKKAEIRRFSSASRLTFLRSIAQIDRGALYKTGVRLISITLTYPHEWPESAEACKRHLNAFRKRLERRFGVCAGFWRLGIQKRGAWHFHLLLFAPPSFGSVGELRSFISTAWYEVCGEISTNHLNAGTRVEKVNSWRQATSFAERYLAKREEFPEGTRTGRVWGVWRKGLLPARWETVPVSIEDAHKVRRAYRRLAGIKSSRAPRNLTVFVRYETTKRLLEYFSRHKE